MAHQRTVASAILCWAILIFTSGIAFGGATLPATLSKSRIFPQMHPLASTEYGCCISWQENIDLVKAKAKALADFMDQHYWLSSTHVTDFFTRDLWQKMPVEVSNFALAPGFFVHALLSITPRNLLYQADFFGDVYLP
jgi:hypothetical protein